MKKLLFVLCMLFTLSVYSQTDSIVTNTNAEKLIDKYSAKIETVIVSLATTLKTPAEHVYKVLVRQQIVEGISLLVGFIFGLLALLFCIRLYKQAEEYSGTEVTLEIMMTFIGILTLVLGGLFIAVGLPSLINPEYGAIKDIGYLIN